jgi:hypothetical protein
LANRLGPRTRWASPATPAIRRPDSGLRFVQDRHRTRADGPYIRLWSRRSRVRIPSLTLKEALLVSTSCLEGSREPSRLGYQAGTNPEPRGSPVVPEYFRNRVRGRHGPRHAAARAPVLLRRPEVGERLERRQLHALRPIGDEYLGGPAASPRGDGAGPPGPRPNVHVEGANRRCSRLLGRCRHVDLLGLPTPRSVPGSATLGTLARAPSPSFARPRGSALGHLVDQRSGALLIGTRDGDIALPASALSRVCACGRGRRADGGAVLARGRRPARPRCRLGRAGPRGSPAHPRARWRYCRCASTNPRRPRNGVPVAPGMGSAPRTAAGARA